MQQPEDIIFNVPEELTMWQGPFYSGVNPDKHTMSSLLNPEATITIYIW